MYARAIVQFMQQRGRDKSCWHLGMVDAETAVRLQAQLYVRFAEALMKLGKDAFISMVVSLVRLDLLPSLDASFDRARNSGSSSDGSDMHKTYWCNVSYADGSLLSLGAVVLGPVDTADLQRRAFIGSLFRMLSQTRCR